MLDQLNKKELKAQLKANSITIPVGANETVLRELLAKAIEEEKAELKVLSGNTGNDKGNEESEGESENEEQQVPEQEPKQNIEGLTGKQATIMDCLRVMQGLPLYPEKDEKNDK